MAFRPLFSLLLLAFLLLPARSFAGEALRERLSLDLGWKFHLGDAWPNVSHYDKAGTNGGPAASSFGDYLWRSVNLPHDWAIELPFDRSADGSHGFRAVGRGFPENSVAWYRRGFELSKDDEGKRVWLEFDGAFRDTTVWVNGWQVLRNESGYYPFRADVTDLVQAGRNLVAVKVDASKFEGWFYEGAGVYRHVWLTKTSPLAIAPDGIFVRSSFKGDVPSDEAEVLVDAKVLNSSNVQAPVAVKCEILSMDGRRLASCSQSGEAVAGAGLELKLSTKLAKPELWSPESPTLYRLVSTVESGGKDVDRVETVFGVRTIAFDKEKGFLLNGRPYVLKGTCNHQDHAGVGAAIPDRLQSYRIERLKEMGSNSYRTSHNPPTPELLEACDRLGMIVMDENRLLGSDPDNMLRLETFVRRDRNHPSVCIWSICNEETLQTAAVGGRVGAAMQSFVKRLDPTRPVTAALSCGAAYSGLPCVLEVHGWNYAVGKGMDDYHAKHPEQPNVGTEQASTVCTRGIYANDQERGYVSSYDDNAPFWAHRAETWWSFFAERPWLSGGFAWTGFDYRGEPTPYGWPCVNSHFGILDTCGFPKDNFYYYQAWWGEKPMVHLLPHWSWPGREGQEIDVRCFSNADEVELFQDGASLGRQTMPKNSHLAWKVKYSSGSLLAKAYKGGKLVAEDKVETAGAPAGVKIVPDRSTVNADGEDLSVVAVAVVDSKGRVVPTAGNFLRFELEGPGRILGVGNGDPSCHEPDCFIAAPKRVELPLKDWRMKELQDAKSHPETAAEFQDGDWAKANVASGSGPLKPKQIAVFRSCFELKKEDLERRPAVLCFGMIDDEGWVYVNGKLAGESRNWEQSPAFEVGGLLKEGSNSVAVLVKNNDGAGGLNKGACLQFSLPPERPLATRSAFNGLAQVIVQAGFEPGSLKLRVSSEGLKAEELAIESVSAKPRPAAR